MISLNPFTYVYLFTLFITFFLAILLWFAPAPIHPMGFMQRHSILKVIALILFAVAVYFMVSGYMWLSAYGYWTR